MTLSKSFFFTLLLTLFSQIIFAQGFLHRDGKYIYDGSGNEVILKGIGTGNWMLMEGYMMQTAGIAGTQHEFRAKLEATIGVEKTDTFFKTWLDSHFRRIDVDSMKSWGFNSVRVAMHYKWFTPPIEEEPIQGEITWLNKGFEMIDSLLDWCSDNEMYLVLDMHGAPGGQGKNADISDYDPSKPSLWESRENKDKLIALWRKLAERYSDAPWMGGYDLINETNWDLGSGNKPLWDLHKEITAAIREVDNNHLIFIEGNWFANDFSGLPAIWDDNLALSFHHYWSYNNDDSFDWVINLRNNRNVPLWLGETGENSNTWFTNAIKLAESKRIGWSWWPVKKPSINNVLNVEINEDYEQLIRYWDGKAPHPGEEEAFQAVMKFAENHRLENCKVQKDVIDAMMRQPFSTQTIPFKVYKTEDTIFAADYNLGRNGYAYYDQDTANYSGATDEYTAWNSGWGYRNDGVDIENCSDKTSNGYSVGWTADGEWMEYTIEVDSTAAYSVDIRSASGTNGSKAYMLSGESVASELFTLPGTSGWQAWRTSTFKNVILEKGTQKIRFAFEKGGSNLNYFKFYNPVHTDSVSFNHLTAETSSDGKYIYLSLNKIITNDNNEINISDFKVTINNTPFEISSVLKSEENQKQLIIELEEEAFYRGIVKLTYRGNTISSSEQNLERFANLDVANRLPARFKFPVRIQAEDFHFNNGFVRENCSDAGGGYNMGYANPGDYLDYLVDVPEEGFYRLDFRIASERSNSEIFVQIGENKSFTAVDTLAIPYTGGWQSWQTIETKLYLPKGRYTLRNYVRRGEFNLNWFQGKLAPVTNTTEKELNQLNIYPNPATSNVSIVLPGVETKKYNISIINSVGKSIKEIQSENKIVNLKIDDLTGGLYLVIISDDKNIISKSKLIKK